MSPLKKVKMLLPFCLEYICSTDVLACLLYYTWHRHGGFFALISQKNNPPCYRQEPGMVFSASPLPTSSTQFNEVKSGPPNIMLIIYFMKLSILELN